MELSTSDIIEIVGIIATLFTSITAIVISVVSVRQNSKMMEESTRPYVCVYGVPGATYTIVIKNFGQSIAKIDQFLYDFDLANCLPEGYDIDPFDGIEGTMLAPGQSIHCSINLKHTINQTESISFTIDYSTPHKKYTGEYTINFPIAESIFTSHRTGGTEGSIGAIASILEDMNANLL